MKSKTIILISILLLSGVAPASAFDIVRPNEEYQDCVGMTVQYCRDNPEYIPCSTSYHPYFKMSHMVAVKIIDGETIHVVDKTKNAAYGVHNWQLDGQYYHFWIDEPVLRNWGLGRVLDNRNVIVYA